MTDLNNIFNIEMELDKVYVKINSMFNLNIDKQLKDLNYRFEMFHEIIDLVNDTKYYSIGLENTDLNFLDRNSLLEVLIKFIDAQITNIPIELESLENERSNARYWDDIQHFHETEALSEKESKLDKLKSKLAKEFNKKSKK